MVVRLALLLLRALPVLEPREFKIYLILVDVWKVRWQGLNVTKMVGLYPLLRNLSARLCETLRRTLQTLRQKLTLCKILLAPGGTKCFIDPFGPWRHKCYIDLFGPRQQNFPNKTYLCNLMSKS